MIIYMSRGATLAHQAIHELISNVLDLECAPNETPMDMLEERLAHVASQTRDNLQYGAGPSTASHTGWFYVKRIFRDLARSNASPIHTVSERAGVWRVDDVEVCVHITNTDNNRDFESTFPRANVNIVRRIEGGLSSYVNVRQEHPQRELFPGMFNPRYVTSLEFAPGGVLRVILFLQYNLTEGLIYAHLAIPGRIERHRIVSWASYARLAVGSARCGVGTPDVEPDNGPQRPERQPFNITLKTPERSKEENDE
jgi:hypothetical protein